MKFHTMHTMQGMGDIIYLKPHPNWKVVDK